MMLFETYLQQIILQSLHYIEIQKMLDLEYRLEDWRLPWVSWIEKQTEAGARKLFSEHPRPDFFYNYKDTVPPDVKQFYILKWF